MELWQQSVVGTVDLDSDGGELRTFNPFSVLDNLAENLDLQISNLGGCGSKFVGSSPVHSPRATKILGLKRWNSMGNVGIQVVLKQQLCDFEGILG